MDALTTIFSKYYFPPESDSFHAARFESKGSTYVPFTTSRIPSLSKPELNHPATKTDSNRLRVPTRADLKAVSEAMLREVRYESRYLIAEAVDIGYLTCLRDIWDKVGGEKGVAQSAATSAKAGLNQTGSDHDRRTNSPRATRHLPSRQESRLRDDRPVAPSRHSSLVSASEWDRRGYEEKTNPPPPEKYPRLPRPPVTASIGRVDESKRPAKLTSGKKDGEKKLDYKGKEKPKSDVHSGMVSKYRILD